MGNNDIAIRVSNVSKTFKLPHQKHKSIKSLFVSLFRGARSYEKQDVLHDISFDVKKGEFLGIVGRNGSGKSTLLKLLAGIYVPDSGEIQVEGKLTPFIELGVGFNVELSGRDNVFLNGALLGFSRKEMEAMYDEIVQFAELERFMDQKLKNYSSGMQVRLAFSIAIQAQSDILVLDEVLAVGDEAFQRKCNEYFVDLKKQGRTVILVTHSMDAVRKFCDRAILIKEGRIAKNGRPDEVANDYSIENLAETDEEKNISKKDKEDKPSISAKIVGDRIVGNNSILQVKVTYYNNDDRAVCPKLIIYHEQVAIIVAHGKISYDLETAKAGEHTVLYKLPLEGFNRGEANIVALLVDLERDVNLADFGFDKELPFIITDAITGGKIGGIMRDTGAMELKK